MTLTTRLFTLFNGRFIGEDPFGNRYYCGRRLLKGRREKRWVIYHGRAEPSKVTPEWHGWLHHTVDIPPTSKPRKRYFWQKPPQANLSGTAQAYLPPGHLRRGGRHAPTMSEYQPWQP
ncbi:MAG: NADH:ubiquinone oxidoreductase subunit NDUFA12 [Alphaproteobacteria bacterium]|nr:NADH:ubiquinone oxidoreductase subunit NDUFA12 [Alphaproteobacteria bacterium]